MQIVAIGIYLNFIETRELQIIAFNSLNGLEAAGQLRNSINNCDENNNVNGRTIRTIRIICNCTLFASSCKLHQIIFVLSFK